MRFTIRTRLVVVGLAAFALLAAACAPEEGAAPEDPQERTISLLAVQHSMDRHVDDTPFPDTLEEWPQFEQWPGYRLDPPDEDGEWYARAYAFEPGTIVVNEGDEVTLQLFGIHGDEHPSVIQGYDVSFNIKRGELEQVTFTADQPGVFPLICADHMPSMVGQLVVLPN